jgi:MFS family permease
VPRAATLLGISVLWLPLAFAFDGATVLLLPVLLETVAPGDRQATTLGLLSAAALIGAVVVQPFAGSLSDRLRARFGRRGFILGAGVLVLAALVMLGASPGLVGVAVGYVGLQLAAAAVQAGEQGFIPDLVPASWRGRAAGLKGAFDVGGGFVAFLVLGALLAAGQQLLAVAVIGGVFVVALVTMTVLVREDREPERTAAVPRSNPWTNVVFVRLVASRFAFLLGVYIVGRFFVLFVAARLGLATEEAAGQAGALLAALTLATAASAIPGGWIADRTGRVPGMVLGATVATIGIAGLIGAASQLTILAFGGLMAIGTGAFVAANWAMTADVVPAGDAARFMGLANIGTGGAAAAAGLLGPVLDAAGRDVGFTILLVIASVATAASLVPLRGLATSTSLHLAPTA